MNSKSTNPWGKLQSLADSGDIEKADLSLLVELEKDVSRGNTVPTVALERLLNRLRQRIQELRNEKAAESAIKHAEDLHQQAKDHATKLNNEARDHSQKLSEKSLFRADIANAIAGVALAVSLFAVWLTFNGQNGTKSTERSKAVTQTPLPQTDLFAPTQTNGVSNNATAPTQQPAEPAQGTNAQPASP